MDTIEKKYCCLCCCNLYFICDKNLFIEFGTRVNGKRSDIRPRDTPGAMIREAAKKDFFLVPWPLRAGGIRP